MQRTRTLRNHEALLRKYNQKGSGGEKSEKKKEKITTFLPKLSEGICVPVHLINEHGEFNNFIMFQLRPLRLRTL